MRLSTQRVEPLTREDFSEEARAVVVRTLPEETCSLNVIATFGRIPAALAGFLSWADYILSKNSLTDREREIVTLRTAHLARSDYEMARHVEASRAAGVTPDEFDRIRQGPEAGWNPADAALIGACDDLFDDQCVSDAVWRSLVEHFGQRKAMDVVMTSAQYFQLAMMLNSFGVQVEPEVQARLRDLLKF